MFSPLAGGRPINNLLWFAAGIVCFIAVAAVSSRDDMDGSGDSGTPRPRVLPGVSVRPPELPLGYRVPEDPEVLSHIRSIAWKCRVPPITVFQGLEQVRSELESQGTQVTQAELASGIDDTYPEGYVYDFAQALTNYIGLRRSYGAAGFR